MPEAAAAVVVQVVVNRRHPEVRVAWAVADKVETPTSPMVQPRAQQGLRDTRVSPTRVVAVAPVAIATAPHRRICQQPVETAVRAS
jgi:hypothetical protein